MLLIFSFINVLYENPQEKFLLKDYGHPATSFHELLLHCEYSNTPLPLQKTNKKKRRNSIILFWPSMFFARNCDVTSPWWRAQGNSFRSEIHSSTKHMVNSKICQSRKEQISVNMMWINNNPIKIGTAHLNLM